MRYRRPLVLGNQNSTVPHLAVSQSSHGIAHASLVERELFDLRGDLVSSAELEHLSHLARRNDDRALDADALGSNVEHDKLGRGEVDSEGVDGAVGGHERDETGETLVSTDDQMELGILVGRELTHHSRRPHFRREEGG